MAMKSPNVFVAIPDPISRYSSHVRSMTGMWTRSPKTTSAKPVRVKVRKRSFVKVIMNHFAPSMLQR